MSAMKKPAPVTETTAPVPAEVDKGTTQMASEARRLSRKLRRNGSLSRSEMGAYENVRSEAKTMRARHQRLLRRAQRLDAEIAHVNALSSELKKQSERQMREAKRSGSRSALRRAAREAGKVASVIESRNLAKMSESAKRRSTSRY